jgi:hypothetical protein
MELSIATDVEQPIFPRLMVEVTDQEAMTFYNITRFLITKNHISEAEQSRAFIRGFQPNLWAHIAHVSNSNSPTIIPTTPISSLIFTKRQVTF